MILPGANLVQFWCKLFGRYGSGGGFYVDLLVFLDKMDVVDR